MDRIERYLEELGKKCDIWHGGVCVNYALAYNKAYRSFTAQLRADEEYRKRQVEIFLLAASVATSTFMIAAFASASLRALAARGAIAVICNNNLNRTFNAVYAVSNSQPAMFAIGKVLDVAKSTTIEKIKKTTESAYIKLSTISSDNPFDHELKLRQFIYLSSFCAKEIVTSVRDDNKISMEERNAIMDRMEKAPIFNPPCAVIGGEALAKRMELTLFMNHILESDYLEDIPFKPYSFGTPGSVNVFQKRNLTSIQHLPSDKSYPNPAKAEVHSAGVGAHQKIIYKEYGPGLENYIETLHQEVVGVPFFKDLPNLTKMQSALVKAESTLYRLADDCRPLYIDMVKV